MSDETDTNISTELSPDDDAALTAAFESAFDGEDTDPGASGGGSLEEGQDADAIASGKDGGAEGDEESAGADDTATPAAPAAGQEPAWAEVVQRLETRLRHVEGRNGELVSKIRQMEGQPRDSAPADKPTAEQLLAAVREGGPKLQALKEEFPEFADAAEEQRSQLVDYVNQRITESQSTLPQALSKQEVIDLADAIADTRVQDLWVEIKHPGWKGTVNTPNFVSWFAQQPDDIRQLANSSQATDSIALLDRYQESQRAGVRRTQQAQEQQDRLAGSVPATGGGKTPGRRVLSAEEEFERAFSEGRMRRGA